MSFKPVSLMLAAALVAGAAGVASAEPFSVQPIAPGGGAGGSGAAQELDSLPGVRLEAGRGLTFDNNCIDRPANHFDGRSFGTMRECQVGNFTFSTTNNNSAYDNNSYFRLYGDNPPPWASGWRP